MIVNWAVPGVAKPASYVRAAELRQVVSIWSRAAVMPEIAVTQPTVSTTVGAVGSIK